MRPLSFRLLLSAAATLAIGFAPFAKAADDADKPIKALLVLGGCCHDYAKQKDLITKGISARANVQWTIAYDPDKGTKHLNPVYESDDWYKGFDVVVHDECTADVVDMKAIDRILKPHKDGLPGVVLHCGMHCYRSAGWPKVITPWFEYTGLQTTGHGAQLPIEVSYIDKESPITKGFENWKTVNEELYNNIAGNVLPTAHALARGKQGKDDTIVVWTNLYNNKAKVFATTLGHNNETVNDPKYLDLITRGLLWSLDKLDDAHLKPAKQVMMDGAPEAGDGYTKKAKAAAAPTGPVPENLALGKKATASSVQGGNEIASATDGDPETRWCASDGRMPQWYQVDLGKPEDLTAVRILWEKDDAGYVYKLEGSADGKSYSQIAAEASFDAKPALRVHKTDAKGVRYVRLTVTGASAGWASLYELQVLGTKLVDASTQKSLAAASGADQLLSQVTAPQGFKVSIFAQPPLVNYPTCLTAAPTGEVFIGIDEMGSLGKQSGRGRIVRANDTDQDGKADEIIEFAKVDHPRGMVWDQSTSTLYVLHPPMLSAYRDTNGDGKADEEKVLVEGIANTKIQTERGADHTTNGIQMGIDGWIYVACGDFGFTDAKGTDGKHAQLHGGGIARVRPDGSELEVVARGTRNIYDIAISPTLDLFTRDNTNDGGGWDVRLSHIPMGGNMGYPSLFKNFPDEHIQPLADYGGGSPCGSIFLDEPGMPGVHGRGLYTCEWGRSMVYFHPLTPNGSTFKAQQQEFIKIPRPTDMDVDGSGRLYVSSWRGGEFNYAGPNIGFVALVQPELCCGATPAEFPPLKKMSDNYLLERLSADSAVMRFNAQREILVRGSKPAFVEGLTKLATDGPSLASKVIAIFTLKQLQGDAATPALVKLAAREDVREFALKALADRKTQNQGVPADVFTSALSSNDARVRLEAVTAIERLGRKVLGASVAPLLADGDPVVQHLTVNTMVELGASDAALATFDNASPSSPSLGAARRVLQGMHDPAVVSALIQRLDSGKQDVEHRKATITALARLFFREADWKGDWWSTRPDTSGPYYHAETWTESPRIGTALDSALASAASDPAMLKFVIGEFQKHKIVSPQATQMLVALATKDETFAGTAVDMIADRDELSADLVPVVAKVAASSAQPADRRARALRALQRTAGKVPAAHEAVLKTVASLDAAYDQPLSDELDHARDDFLRDGRNASDVKKWVALAGASEPGVKETAYAVLMHVAQNRRASKSARDEASSSLDSAFSDKASLTPFLRAAGLTKLTAYAPQVRANIASADKPVRDAANWAASEMKLVGAHDPNAPLIAKIGYDKAASDAMTTHGDLAVGKALFTRQGCIACHTVDKSEPPKGPFLGDIGARYGRAELAESVLKPSAKIAQGFTGQYFLDKKGNRVDGFVTKESGDEVEVRTAAGTVQIVKLADVKRRGELKESVMPTALADQLTVEEFGSLVSFLESMKGK